MRWRDVAAYAGGVYVHVVGAVCNRPLGVAMYGHIVGAHCMRPRAITNRPYETMVAIRNHSGHTKTRWSCDGAMLHDGARLWCMYADGVHVHVVGAQAGVRYSIENPFAYVDSNLVGMMCILEGCRHNAVEHLVYASSSSVYGMNDKVPFSEADQVDNPVSLYAATKKANELMAHSYSKLYGIPTTGLRFFTVYGPAGRPDMAPWLFTEAIIKGEPIKVFNHGKMMRDFTYIDDIVEGVIRIQDVIPTADIPYSLFNIGNNEPIELARFIKAIETACGREAEKIMLPMQPGDVPRTYADTARLEAAVGYKPATEIEQGIARFVDWYRQCRG